MGEGLFRWPRAGWAWENCREHTSYMWHFDVLIYLVVVACPYVCDFWRKKKKAKWSGGTFLCPLTAHFLITWRCVSDGSPLALLEMEVLECVWSGTLPVGPGDISSPSTHTENCNMDSTPHAKCGRHGRDSSCSSLRVLFTNTRCHCWGWPCWSLFGLNVRAITSTCLSIPLGQFKEMCSRQRVCSTFPTEIYICVTIT